MLLIKLAAKLEIVGSIRWKKLLFLLKFYVTEVFNFFENYSNIFLVYLNLIFIYIT